MLLETARAALGRVLAARPDLANALALGARLDASEEAGMDPRALQAIRRARAISPGREDFTVIEGFILLRSGEYVQATQLLTPLTGPTHSAGVREQCAIAHRAGGELEREAADYVARLEGTAAGRGSPPASQGRLVQLYRKVEPGEQRVEGLLERIDCSTTGVVVHVSVDGAPSASARRRSKASRSSAIAMTCAAASRVGPARHPIACISRGGRSDSARENSRRVVAVEFLPLPR